jgi:endonuclease-3
MKVNPAAPSRATLRRKVSNAAAILEAVYGAPFYSEPHVLDSLIGCILSQNTNDLNSGRAWRMLRRRFPTWSKAAKAPVDEIEDAIRVGGLSHSKAMRIKAILADLKRSRNRYDLDFLRDMPDGDAFEYLTAMSGVGKKTAAVVLLFAAQRDVFPVDTHIHRIAQRLGWVREGASRDEVFEEMRSLVPEGKAMAFHINLIRFGRERCTKRSPNHDGCPLHSQCLYVRGHVAF